MKRLAGTGVWSGELRYGDVGESADSAAELEELGYTALWIGDVGGDLFGAIGNLLGATKETTVASGILNLWMHSGEETSAGWASLTAEHGDRFLVGIGVSHAVLIDRDGPRYRRPLHAMTEFLDAVDAAEQPLPVDRRVLAALGPKMLELAKDRSAGSHPYLVTPEHTRQVREALGAGAIVAPEQAVVLSADGEAARTAARNHLSFYLQLPNYTNNWRRLGFDDADLADGGSDRLVDALVVIGDEAAIAGRVQEHRAAGADHVCIQVLPVEGQELRDAWRRLAPALT